MKRSIGYSTVFIILFLLFGYTLKAQTIITGVVSDSLNNPIPSASVYLSKTTVGTLTDNKGVYSLTIPQHGVYEMITSYLGYLSNSQFIAAEGNKQIINIKLYVNLVQLNEVTVKSRDENRIRNYAQFIRFFLGESSNSQICKIKNPEDIHFYRDARTQTLNGFSIKPLLIENRALGYLINYELEDFSFNPETEILRFKGNHYFQPLTGTTKDIKRWERNRLLAYYGSKMHFFRAAFSDSLGHENFEIFECRADSAENEFKIIKPIMIKDLSLAKSSNYMTIFYKNPVEITYTDNHPELSTALTGFTPQKVISTLVFSDFINVYQNGYFDNPYSITWGGEMGNERIADMLPYDFIPQQMTKVDLDSALFISPIDKYLISQKRNSSSDQIFVQTDRNSYSSGDTIYFQAYVRDRFTGLFESHSVELYAILFNDKQMVVDSSRFRIEGSTSAGWMIIPGGTATGKYHFVAFTGSMQNFDPVDAFRLDLSVKLKAHPDTLIYNSRLQVTTKTDSNDLSATKEINVTPEDQYFELKFMPEGGTFIEGLEQRTGFNATNFKGEPIYIEGLLKDSTGTILDTVKSGTYGPGQFVCIPHHGMFMELLNGGGKDKIWPLPDPAKSGITLSVKPVSESSFAVEIQSSGYSGDIVTVSGMMNATRIFSEELTLKEKQRIIVETDQLLSGVAQITLFNKELRPLAERLFYVNAGKRLKFNIKAENAVYSPGQGTELTISVTDGYGNPVEGIFSISVADSLTGHDAELFTPGIEYSYNYNPAFPGTLPSKVLLKGIENISNDERDLLLMVYGWSRYTWDFSDQNKPDRELVNYDLLKMRILYASKNRRAGRRLDLVSLEGPSIRHLMTNAEGEISLPLDSLPDITRSVTMMPDVRNKERVTGAMLSIPYNEKYFRNVKLFTSLPAIPAEAYITSPSGFNISWADSIIEIPEITIKAPPQGKKEYHDKYEERYQYAEVKSIDYELLWTSSTLEDAIYKMITPYMMTDSYIILRPPRSLFGGPANALIVLDGMPVYYDGWSAVRTIPATEITSLTILMGKQGYTMYGEAAQGGVIFVNTQSDDPKLLKLRTNWTLQNKKNNMLLPIDIYRANKEFYCPTRFDINNDPAFMSRSTFYWAPQVYFKGMDPVKIRYNNLKHYGPVIITVNGVSFNNLVGTGRAGYLINKQPLK